VSGEVITRYANRADAIVELHTARFMTTWTRQGPPMAASTPYEVDGYNWRCLGCKRYGRQYDTYNDPGFRELREAEDATQIHADECSAMPPRRRLSEWVAGLLPGATDG
jgi:hypothetical protein